jgi:hypothetical protein
MFSGTTFAIILIDHQSPWMPSFFETFGHAGDCIRSAFGSIVVMVECDVDVASFIIHSLKFLHVKIVSWFQIDTHGDDFTVDVIQK